MSHRECVREREREREGGRKRERERKKKENERAGCTKSKHNPDTRQLL